MSENIRAVIYCRVSTSSDSQMESLDKQVAEAIDTAGQLGYELVDQFIDEGKTGTTKDARKEYLRMLSRIEQKQFDVIITKSLDRMNRNILDFYLFLDLIMKNDVKLYFYLDRTFYKADDKIIIGIKAILAEEYSRELSKKLCSAHSKRQTRGEVVMLGSMTYGYRKVLMPGGKRQVIIEEEEAEMIRLIFSYCREGCGARVISGRLYSLGYRNRKGNQISESTIRRIIRNPLVKGTMVMNKVRVDFNTKKIIHTDPSQWIWKEGAVPAIISDGEWMEANERMNGRSSRQTLSCGGTLPVLSENCRGVNKGKYDFSGKIFCGLCGKPYYRIERKKRDEPIPQWRCSTYVRCGRKHEVLSETAFRTDGDNEGKMVVGCDGQSLEEGFLIKTILELEKAGLNSLWDEERMVSEAVASLGKILVADKSGKVSEEIDRLRRSISERQQVLLEKYLDGKISDESYVLMDGKLQEDSRRLLQKKNNAGEQMPGTGGMKKRLEAIEDFLRGGGIEQALISVFLDSVKCITVCPACLVFEFERQRDPHVSVPLTAQDMVKYGGVTHREAVCLSEKSICEMISENPHITIAEMADALKIGKRTVCSRVAMLKKDGKIGVKGHGPGRTWYIVAKL